MSNRMSVAIISWLLLASVGLSLGSIRDQWRPVKANYLFDSKPSASIYEDDSSELPCGVGWSNQAQVSSRIFGGNETLPGQYPWMVNIFNDTDRWCGGVIIDDRHILTAYHCFGYKNNSLNFHFYTGDYNQWIRDGEFEVEIERLIPHVRDDIVLVRTKQPIEFKLTSNKLGSVNRICLPRQNWKQQHGAQVTVAGWGLIEGYISLNIIRHLEVTIKRCSNPTRAYDAGTLCTTAGNDKGACYGDSGGPLIFRRPNGQFELAGIVRGGFELCGTGIEDDYHGNVHNYLQWIISTIDNY